MGRAFPVLTSTRHIMATHRNGLTPHRIRQKFNLQPQAYFPRLHSKFLLILYSLVSNQALPSESLQTETLLVTQVTELSQVVSPLPSSGGPVWLLRQAISLFTISDLSSFHWGSGSRCCYTRCDGQCGNFETSRDISTSSHASEMHGSWAHSQYPACVPNKCAIQQPSDTETLRRILCPAAILAGGLEN